MQSIKRQTAYVCTAQQLLEGSYVEKEGWEPNYVKVGEGAVSRARVIGVVVDVQPPMQYTLDDGTARINVRFFDPDHKKMELGKPVMVIGRPREYNGERYLAAEIGSMLTTNWAKYFSEQRDAYQQYIPQAPEEIIPEKLEVSEERVQSTDPTTQRSEPVATNNEDTSMTVGAKLIQLIKELDPGDGAPTEDVLKGAGEGAEEKLTMLINEGEVFELRAGKIKVLE